jgi:hypothetical protein
MFCRVTRKCQYQNRNIDNYARQCTSLCKSRLTEFLAQDGLRPLCVTLHVPPLSFHFQTLTIPSRLQDTSIRSVTCKTHNTTSPSGRQRLSTPNGAAARGMGKEELASMAARSNTASRCASAACRRRAEEAPERLGPAVAAAPLLPPAGVA